LPDEIKEARDYARKHGFKLTAHRDGTISIRGTRTKREGTDLMEFEQRMLQVFKGIFKRLPSEYEIIPYQEGFYDINWKRGEWPKVKAVCKMKKREEKGK